MRHRSRVIVAVVTTPRVVCTFYSTMIWVFFFFVFRALWPVCCWAWLSRWPSGSADRNLRSKTFPRPSTRVPRTIFRLSRRLYTNSKDYNTTVTRFDLLSTPYSPPPNKINTYRIFFLQTTWQTRWARRIDREWLTKQYKTLPPHVARPEAFDET